MSSFETIQVINELSLEVRNFKKHRNGKAWSMSCEVCGDSKTNRRKARFGIAEKKDGYVVHCFNCGYSNSFIGYLKDFHPHLYSKLSINNFVQQVPTLYDLNYLLDGKTSDRILINIFYLNKFSNTKYWLDYLVKKKIKLTKNNLKILYKMHKDYWNEPRCL